MQRELLKTSGLSYGVNGKIIVDDVSFEIKRNEFLGIVGPNGTGKSTLLRLLARIINPTGGHILLDGEDISGYEAKELYKKISFLPQTSYFDFPLSVLEVVLTGRYPYLGIFESESTEDIKRAEDCLSLVDLEGFSRRKVTTLSGGEQQRVSIARVLAQETDFIFLDEPSSHLDIHHKFALMELLESLAQEGKGVVAVLHDLDLASKFCERILVLENGRVAALGEPSRVLSEKLLSSVFKVRGSWDPRSENLLVFR
ncbi:MAG: ABC transporter ATP-binding protein [Candidatus Dadabacteria bacterium]|nr:ABC transporter ATP-binding protein [Candidatus Dadabacteria bacterium]MDE0519295.1 ABC transporter ATP-binding protein [Candidatus Dadabacteria bacterium]MDE0663095.1 ABC transporter ATP-binding protein [Candidatus Dadabacteria bacterium]